MSTLPADQSTRVGTSVPVALTVAAVCALLGMAVLTSPAVLAAALAAAVLVVAWGWAGTLALPTPKGTVGTITLGGLGVVAAVALPREGPGLFWVPAALALAMVGAFLHQLLRRDGRPRVVESVSAVVLALGILTCGALIIPLARSGEGTALVLGALAAALASALSDLLGRWRALSGWLTPLALVAGAAAAVAVALMLDAPWTTWLLLGVGAAALSHAMRAVLAPLPSMAQPRPRLVAGIVSVIVVGVAAYLVALALVPAAIVV